MSKNKGKPEDQLVHARTDVEQAKRRLAATLGMLQHRLSPGTLMTNAWDGVREKSGAVADDAMQAVKDRPMTVSGILAALIIFLARDPLWRLVSSLFGSASEDDPSTIKADLHNHDGSFDLTAPTVNASMKEGVDA
jgi:ElaB/YqjD/DUF883 family membrane-anchored ribosome-binding protein